MIRSGLVCVAVLLAFAPSGCGGSSSESAEKTPTPEATIIAAHTDKDGEFWASLSADKRAELAGICKNRVIDATQERFGTDAAGRIANQDDADVADAISSFYESGDQSTSIADACQQAAYGQIKRVALQTDGPGKTKAASAKLNGSVFPPGSNVTVRYSRLTDHAGTGWYTAKTVKVSPSGTFTMRVSLHSGLNDFRVDARHQGMKGANVVFGVEKQKSAAELAAERVAREQTRQKKIAAATFRYSGNGAKTIGTIKVPIDSTLRWTNDGDIFQIFDDDVALFVNSQAHSGDTDAPAGTYATVQVNAIGNWTITVAPK